MAEQLVNPITHLPVDEVIKENEARKRGMLDLEFILKYLEDENEYIKYFVVDGKRIVVDIEKPTIHYKRPTLINHDRVHGDFENGVAEPAKACAIHEESGPCESCSG